MVAALDGRLAALRPQRRVREALLCWPADSNRPPKPTENVNMDRRSFLRNSALLAAGTIAADQLDLIERLGWKRKFFPGASFGPDIQVDDLIHMRDLYRVRQVVWEQTADGPVRRVELQRDSGRGWETLEIVIANPDVNNIRFPALPLGAAVDVRIS